MDWVRLLAYVTGTVDQELLARNEYLVAENRILKAQVKGRLKLSDAKRGTLGEIRHRLGRKVLADVANVVRPETILGWYSAAPDRRPSPAPSTPPRRSSPSAHRRSCVSSSVSSSAPSITERRLLQLRPDPIFRVQFTVRRRAKRSHWQAGLMRSICTNDA